MNHRLPTLRRGTSGPDIEVLRAKLHAVGIPVQGDPTAFFGASTEEAVRSFQRRRNLQVDGICGPDTWSALDEEGHRLGDRLLARRRPMMRGDDVRTLQLRLDSLGFDPGRIDGIFGPETELALIAFQRDAAIAADGICGPDTTSAFARLGHLADGTIGGVRERAVLAATPRQLSGRRVFIASRPTAGPVVEALDSALSAVGVMTARDTSLVVDAEAATPAQTFDADLSVLLQPSADPKWRSAYYSSDRYQSLRGRAIAVCIAESLEAGAEEPRPAAGLTVGFLRETRMPAVVVQLDPAELAAPDSIIGALVQGIRDGFESPPPVD